MSVIHYAPMLVGHEDERYLMERSAYVQAGTRYCVEAEWKENWGAVTNSWTLNEWRTRRQMIRESA